VRLWFPNPPSAVMLILLIVFIGAAIMLWAKEMRQGTPAMKFSCKACQLQWIVRPNDRWPTVDEARQQAFVIASEHRRQL
jgi:xanthosine utilization system XapX-like protein